MKFQELGTEKQIVVMLHIFVENKLFQLSLVNGKFKRKHLFEIFCNINKTIRFESYLPYPLSGNESQFPQNIQKQKHIYVYIYAYKVCTFIIHTKRDWSDWLLVGVHELLLINIFWVFCNSLNAKPGLCHLPDSHLCCLPCHLFCHSSDRQTLLYQPAPEYSTSNKACF